jgi:hypothetical protein
VLNNLQRYQAVFGLAAGPAQPLFGLGEADHGEDEAMVDADEVGQSRWI